MFNEPSFLCLSHKDKNLIKITFILFCQDYPPSLSKKKSPKGKENRAHELEVGMGFPWFNKERFYSFCELCISRRPKCRLASSKLLLLCAVGLSQQTTDPVDRRWWKQGCTPRLRSIFRSWGGRVFYLKERMVMSSKVLVLCRSWDLAWLEKHTSKGM